MLIVVDPWDVQYLGDPHIKGININTYNKRFSKKIIRFSENFEHKGIHFADEGEHVKLDPEQPIWTRDPQYTGWQNFKTTEELIEYMDEHKLSDIVYAGFHYGLCVLKRPCGACWMSKYFTCFVKRSLTPMLPGTEPAKYALDVQTQRWAEILED